MWMQIKAAVVGAVFLAGAAGIACAQGASTQDPGSLTPGNLTFQDLGPAGPVPGPTGRSQATQTPSGYGTSGYGTSGTAGTVTRPGTRSTGFGGGNTSGLGGNAAGTSR
jgi:hypothetical protein